VIYCHSPGGDTAAALAKFVLSECSCLCCCVKSAVDWSGSNQQPHPLYDLQFEDLSILERRPNSDVQSVTGLLSLLSGVVNCGYLLSRQDD